MGYSSISPKEKEINRKVGRSIINQYGDSELF